MASVVALVAPILKASGFRKQRHTFNRATEPGLVHVISFQMGQFPLGYEIQGLRPNLYGKFTVNLGAFVHEVYEVLQRSTPPAFLPEHVCEFRVRLGMLAGPPSDVWWSLDTDAEKLAGDVAEQLGRLAEPWFGRYASRDAILRINPATGAPPGWPLRAELALAVMRAHRGERAEAQALLRRYLEEERRNPGHPEHRRWVVDLGRRLGFEPQEVE
jgi:hypothetical protein